MSTITINRTTISTNGKIIIVKGNKVIIDGKDVTPDSKEINIVVNGDIEKLEADHCDKISVTGNVDNVKTLSGSVEISGDVAGSVHTMSGNLNCGNISGSVTTMSGNIRHK